MAWDAWGIGIDPDVFPSFLQSCCGSTRDYFTHRETSKSSASAMAP